MSPTERWEPEYSVKLMTTSAIQPYGLPLRQTGMKIKGMWNQLSIRAVRAFLQIPRENYAICCKTRHLPPRWCPESIWANIPSLLCGTNRAYFLILCASLCIWRHLHRKDLVELLRICIVKLHDVVIHTLRANLKLWNKRWCCFLRCAISLVCWFPPFFGGSILHVTDQKVRPWASDCW